jgi:hypothetical protein
MTNNDGSGMTDYLFIKVIILLHGMNRDVKRAIISLFANDINRA